MDKTVTRKIARILYYKCETIRKGLLLIRTDIELEFNVGNGNLKVIGYLIA